jgi:uncharacterized protein YgbK (DUF1537 family)
MIGCIADDYTGGTDVAAARRPKVCAPVLLLGLPDANVQLQHCDAVGVALKSRALDGDRTCVTDRDRSRR